MDNLHTKKCAPCEGGVEPMKPEEFSTYLSMVANWFVVDNKMIEKIFILKDFQSAINFINQIAKIAEEEGHHPDILLYNWNKVKIMLTTHAIGGLSINDFIIASKIDRL
ncbi:MAG: Pterin-4-alpha-carbinolamine dehydratase [Ignavibacteriae bacterium]|nr:MAG: Pterin-4-alpha-carbinolamine dehydratase [Ignavibacteriota bacterium]